MRNLSDLLQTALIAAAALLASAPVLAHPVSGELYYTRYTRYSGAPNVKKVPFRFDGARLILGSKSHIGAVGGADGIAFTADGDLIVGGQGDRVHKVKTDGSGAHNTVSAGGGASFHVTLDPDGARVWTAGQPGALVEVPLRPFTDGVIHQPSGDDTTITAIAFDGGGAAFYTASDYRGGGRFGAVDLTTFTTHRLLSGIEAAHAIVFDPFTGDLFLFGGNDIAQIDPLAPTMIKSSRRFHLDSQFDQGTTRWRGPSIRRTQQRRSCFRRLCGVAFDRRYQQHHRCRLPRFEPRRSGPVIGPGRQAGHTACRIGGEAGTRGSGRA